MTDQLNQFHITAVCNAFRMHVCVGIDWRHCDKGLWRVLTRSSAKTSSSRTFVTSTRMRRPSKRTSKMTSLSSEPCSNISPSNPTSCRLKPIRTHPIWCFFRPIFDLNQTWGGKLSVLIPGFFFRGFESHCNNRKLSFEVISGFENMLSFFSVC